MPPVIKVENLSKMYRLGEVGTGTVRDDLARAWAKLRGREDPFQKVGQVNRRDEAADGDHEYVWALQDINFEVKQGEILGIIGRNGAGKSTLLKLLSRITSPTTGRIRARGRIASLLEVGTGFHPELTGRENIYLNGALLGMTRREVTNRLEEIVEFSGCAKYIDTPVKRYSSGMMVRLGFSVAAHLECEILIVDEVLAVGDAEFQKRCLGKMSDVANDGRTILFVSHNMASVRSLTNTCLLLKSGYVSEIAHTQTVLDRYARENLHQRQVGKDGLDFFRREHNPAARAQIINIYAGNTISGSTPIKTVESGTPLSINLVIRATELIPDAYFSLVIMKDAETVVMTLFSQDNGSHFDLTPGMHTISCALNNISLTGGTYSVTAGLGGKGKTLDVVLDVPTFDVVMPELENGRLTWPNRPWGSVYCPSATWSQN